MSLLYMRTDERINEQVARFHSGYRHRPATSVEALQYALTCQTCGGSGFTQPTKCKHGQRNMHGGGESMCAGPVGERGPCPDCIDGIPREWVEVAAEALLDGRKPYVVWAASVEERRQLYRGMVHPVLLALRDKEEPRD